MPIQEKNLKQLSEIPDSEIDYSDIPELDEDWFNNANIVYPLKKKPISLRVDLEVLEWFKAQGKRYQSHMNAVLQAYVKAQKKRINKINE